MPNPAPEPVTVPFAAPAPASAQQAQGLAQRAVVRQARVEDAEAVAALVHLAGPEVYDFVFGPKRARVLDFICHEFRSGRGYARFQNVQVVALDGEVVAALVSYTAACGPLMFLGWLANVLGFYGTLNALPVLRRAWQARPVMNAPLPGGLYVSELGVAARCRGQGLGTLLMQSVIEHARLQGLRSVSLSVSSRHASARRLYRRLGFEVPQPQPEPTPPVGLPRALSPTCFMSLRLLP